MATREDLRLNAGNVLLTWLKYNRHCIQRTLPVEGVCERYHAEECGTLCISMGMQALFFRFHRGMKRKAETE